MSKLPDQPTLDDMVLGDESPDGIDAWEAMVMAPGGANAWEAAALRRQQLDALAALTRGRPWLARQMLMLRRAGRKLKQLSSIRLEVTQYIHPVHATLVPTDQTADVLCRLRWGEHTHLAIPVGDVVEIRAASGPDVVVGYAWEGGSGILSKNVWRLEAGEWPVHFVVFRGNHTEGLDDFASMMENADAVAGLVLTERTSQEMGETEG